MNCPKHGTAMKPLFTSMYCPKCDSEAAAPSFYDSNLTFDPPASSGQYYTVTSPTTAGYATVATGSATVTGPINWTGVGAGYTPYGSSNPPIYDPVMYLETTLRLAIASWKAGQGTIVDRSTGANVVIGPNKLPSGDIPWICKNFTKQASLIDLYLLYAPATYPSLSLSQDPATAMAQAAQITTWELDELCYSFDGTVSPPVTQSDFYDLGQDLRRLR